jgi:hypothetical protein
MTEEWIVKVDKQEFVTDEKGKAKIVQAMQNDKRFVAISDTDIISVRHISYLYRSKKMAEYQLPEGEAEKTEQRISDEKFEKIKREALAKIGKPIH